MDRVDVVRWTVHRHSRPGHSVAHSPTTPHQCGWTALLHAAAATAASSGPGGAARDEVVKTLLNHAANPRLKDNVLRKPAAQLTAPNLTHDGATHRMAGRRFTLLRARELESPPSCCLKLALTQLLLSM